MPTPLFAIGFLLMGSVFIAFAFGFVGRAPRVQGPGAHDGGFIAKFRMNLQLDLDEAGIDMTPRRFLAYAATIGIVLGLLVALVTGKVMMSLVVAGFFGLYACRAWYIGRLAGKRREAQLEYLVDAAEDIATGVEQGATPAASLAKYASQRVKERGGLAPGAVPNQIADQVNLAITNQNVRGIRIEQGLSIAADQLGNRYFRAFVETYLRNAGQSTEQLVLALRQFADEVRYVAVLRDEKRTALALPLVSYQMMVFLVAGMAAFVAVSTKPGALFYETEGGGTFLVVIAAYLYLGYRLQRRGLEERY